MKLSQLKSNILPFFVPVCFFTTLFVFQFIGGFLPDELKPYGLGVFGSITVFCLTLLVLKIEKKTLKDIGMVWEGGTLVRFFKGFGIGLTIVLLLLGVIVGFTDLELSINQDSSLPLIFIWMGAFIPLGWMEEVAMRGHVFVRLNQKVGLRITLVITAILFAYYHDFTGQTFLDQLMGPGIWAFVYGMAAMWSDGIALPTGIHVAANVVLSAFGLKQGYNSIVDLEYSKEVTDAMSAQTDVVGIACQVILLLGAIVVMEWYIRNNKGINNKIYTA